MNINTPCSTLGKELKHLNKTITYGFHLQGRVKILGYSVYLESTITLDPINFAILVEFSPMKIGGGLIALQRSKAESDMGPMLMAKIDASGVAIKINAFLSILGISAGILIDVSNKGFEFEISGSLFNVISAKLNVKSQYSDIKTASFSVRNFCKAFHAFVLSPFTTCVSSYVKQSSTTT